jgi:hypothetical protein
MDAKGIPTVVIATAGTGNAVLGPILGAAGTGVGGDYGVPIEAPLVIPATKARNYYVFVCDDPDVEFEVQEDSVGGSIAAASQGLNCNLIAGTNNGFRSGWELDSSSVAGTATLQVKLLRPVQAVDNAFVSANCRWLVSINNHPYKAGVAGI